MAKTMIDTVALAATCNYLATQLYNEFFKTAPDAVVVRSLLDQLKTNTMVLDMENPVSPMSVPPVPFPGR